MRNYRYLLFFILFLSAPADVFAQEKYEEYSTYWRQRQTLFEHLPDGRREILFVGDSITDGGEWSEMFRNRRIKNRGISGDVTDGVLERLHEVLSSRPAKLFLMIGINDLSRGKSQEYVIKNIKEIIGRIRRESPRTKIYLQSILPVNPTYEKFSTHTNKTPEIKYINRTLSVYAREVGIVYINLFSSFSTDDETLNPEYTNDGLHLTGAGYLLWKSLIEAYIN